MRDASRRMRRFAVALAVSVPAALATSPVVAAVINVVPGPNALGAALAAANPGDTLRIHAGTYAESVTISVANLKLVGAGDGVATIDGGCATDIAIAVRANGVILAGLRVIGAGGSGGFPKAIDFDSVASGAVLGSIVEETCGDAEYGINVFQCGGLTLAGNVASGFGDAGIYIGGITATPNRKMLIVGNELEENTRGIIVEDSAGGTILVQGNSIRNNDTTGIFLTNSDGVRIVANSVTGNGDAGIELNATSDQNRVLFNQVTGNGTDLVNDGGAGNCWLGNPHASSSGDVGC